MNSLHFERARSAYGKGEYVDALKEYYACLKEDNASFGPGDVGLICYRLGNCLLKMRSFQEASITYGKALEDEAYADKATVRVNLGKSQIGMGDYEGAITSFNAALADPTFQKSYQAHMGLGTAFTRLGMLVDAGTSYRNAALDERNPNPVKALVQLGNTFASLNRPQDAIESYKTVFEFEPSDSVRSKVNESLGQAYTAAGRYKEAVESFTFAGAGGRYALSAEAALDFQKAQEALQKSVAPAPSAPANRAGFAGQDPYAVGATAEMPNAAYDNYGFGEAASVAGADMMSGNYAAPIAPGMASASYQGGYGSDIGLMPDGSYGLSAPEVFGDTSTGTIPSLNDTDFFTATDDDLIAMGKSQMRKERRGRNAGLKILLTVLIVMVLVLGGGVFAYWQGLGFPSQKMVISDMFAAHREGNDVLQYWAAGEDSEEIIARKMNQVAPTERVEVSIESVSMSESEAIVVAYLVEKPGELRYSVKLERSFIGWKIADLNLNFASQQSS
ncbi:MAG: tetratricopeptide repeat protein [Coriobacteriia bacterium]|nr:tetratricopeptide repeat protein [Coriobacteriia bacterium]